jgi:hypothetical protein
MDEGDFRRRIAQSWRLLYDEMKIGRTVSSLFSLPVSKSFNDIAFSSSSTYAEIYLSAVSLSYYNLMLSDYAIFQYSWDGEESWRLAYYPNPWISGVADVEKVVEEWETIQSLGEINEVGVDNLIAELPYQGAIPAIRFEYASHQYKEIAHPAAHLHIGRHTENLWPLARPLDPLTFTMDILKLYYPSNWRQFSSFHGSSYDPCIDRRFIEELGKMRIVHQFSVDERRSLHITSM